MIGEYNISEYKFWNYIKNANYAKLWEVFQIIFMLSHGQAVITYWDGFLDQQWTYGRKHERVVINYWSFCVWHSEKQCCSFQWNSINPQIITKCLSSNDEISITFRRSKKTHCWKGNLERGKLYKIKSVQLNSKESY